MSNKVEVIKRPIEQMGSDVKKTAWSAVFESLIIVILGVLCVVMPDTIVKAIAIIVGVFFLVKGGITIADYIMEKTQKDYFNTRLIGGIISVLLGIIVLVMGQDIARVFSIIIGIIIIYESLLRVSAASKLHAAGLESWKSIMAIAIIMLIVGIYVTFGSGGVVPLVGWMMILVGVIGVVGDVIFIQYVNAFVNKLTGKNNQK